MVDVLVVCTVVIGAGGVCWRHRVEATAMVLSLWYSLPLLLLTAFAQETGGLPGLTLPDTVANACRVAIHLGVGVWCFMTGPTPRVSVASSVAFASIAMMALSVAAGDSGSDEVLRVGVTIAMCVTVFVLLPSRASKDFVLFSRSLPFAVLVLAVAVLVITCYAILAHGWYPTWTRRLSRPWNANVLANLLVGVVVLVAGSKVGVGRLTVLAVAIVATGSRLAIGELCLFGGYWACFFGDRRTFVWVGIVGACVVSAGVLIGEGGRDVVHETLFSRSDFSSQRRERWTNSLAASEGWALGAGRRDDEEGGNDLRTHNLFLELSRAYGVPCAILSLTVYAVLLIGQSSGLGGMYCDTRRSGIALAGVCILQSMVSTTAWINLGDGVSVLQTSVLAAFAFPRSWQVKS